MDGKEKYLLIRYAEIALKGKNRVDFERQLIRNIKNCFSRNNHNFIEINRYRGRIIIQADYFEELKHVFGISSISPSIKTTIEVSDIKSELDYFINKVDNNLTFRASVQRITKDTKLNSMQLEQELGAYIVSKTNAKVSLKQYQNNYSVEIINGSAYVFTDKYSGCGGLPIGSQGQAYVVIEGDYKKGILSGILLMKRGCLVYPLVVNGESFESGMFKKYLYGYEYKEYKTEKGQLLSFVKENKVDCLIYSDDEIVDTRITNCLELHPLIGFDKDMLCELEKVYLE